MPCAESNSYPASDPPPDPQAKSGIGADYASCLLGRFGPLARSTAVSDDAFASHPDFEWARSGAMFLTGTAKGPPLLAPGPLASCARGALLALRTVAGEDWDGGDVDAPALLGERAALFGYFRRGAVSPGGSCRLLRTLDGWLAVNLARESDRDLIPAWLEADCPGDPWQEVENILPRRSSESWLERARLMGLPIAEAGGFTGSGGLTPLGGFTGSGGVAGYETPEVKPRGWLTRSPGRLERRGGPGASRESRTPLVLDLTTLWAGPLCASLLSMAGARVLKVESLGRPDGARGGDSAFFDLLNHGKENVALDLQTDTGLRRLRALIEVADIVLESARPRALIQLGISASEWVAKRSGLTWLSITGYGRGEPEAGWVAFGDDAAAAAGLAMGTARCNRERLADPERPIFCADAIADPLTGLHAAVAAYANWKSGESALLDTSLRGVTSHCLEFRSNLPETLESDSPEVFGGAKAGWALRIGDESQEVREPRARPSRGSAARLGADTGRVLAEFGIA